MKTLKIAVLAGVVMLSAPAFAQEEDITTTLSNLVIEQSSKALDSIQTKLGDELSKKFDEAVSALMPTDQPQAEPEKQAQDVSPSTDKDDK
ncbi:hypothetical protein [Gallaecimonas mangrovi]|uniref:hypothetical protein n=1 Tax=Gallaecimonas mangrovi TaxID=2291597 RepID=UPI000E207149|nr:hypothetical protein [Gallaecimonas mangrovi]